MNLGLFIGCMDGWDLILDHRGGWLQLIRFCLRWRAWIDLVLFTTMVVMDKGRAKICLVLLSEG